MGVDKEVRILCIKTTTHTVQSGRCEKKTKNHGFSGDIKEHFRGVFDKVLGYILKITYLTGEFYNPNTATARYLSKILMLPSDDKHSLARQNKSHEHKIIPIISLGS